MAQGVAAGGCSGTAAGAGASTAADGDQGTAKGGQGGAGDPGSAALECSSVSSAAGAGHGAAAGLAARLSVDAGLDHGAAAGSPSGSASSACLEGIDPNSSYVLKIRLLGNPKKARKEIKCFYFEKVIDSDLTNYKDLLESIVVQYQPRYLEVAHVHYYDDVLKTFSEIKSNQELMYMFEKHAKTKMVQMFIVYWDPSEPYEPITEYYSDVHIHPNNNTEQDEDSYLRNPIPENEHVGIDEENMYLKKEPKTLNVVLFPDKEKDQDYVADDESDDKKGNPEDIAAMMAVREPPKKRTKTTKTAELSIVPCEDGAPTRMCFPPSQSLETTTKKKGKHVNSSAGASKSKSLENTNKKGKGGKSESVRSKRPRTGSNQPEPISIEFPMPGDETNVPVKVRGKSKRKSALTRFLWCHKTAQQCAQETKNLTLQALQ